MLCCKERRRGGGANSTYASLSKICVIKSRRRMFLISVFVLVRRRLRKISKFALLLRKKGGNVGWLCQKSQNNQRNGRKGRRNHGRKGKGEGEAVSQKERAEWHAIPNSNSDTAMSSPPSNEGERGVGVDPTRPDPPQPAPCQTTHRRKEEEKKSRATNQNPPTPHETASSLLFQVGCSLSPASAGERGGRLSLFPRSTVVRREGMLWLTHSTLLCSPSLISRGRAAMSNEEERKTETRSSFAVRL